MKLQDLCTYLDSVVPLSFQEGYDNSGLQVGRPDKTINSALLTLDVTEEVIDEAIIDGSDIIISHHPVIFTGIKKITGRSLTERILLRAIRNDISIYSSHTNLDTISNGVSFKMAQKAGLQNVKVLSPLKNKLLKLVVFIPEDYLSNVSQALFDAGAGVIGNYDRCGFTVNGTGSFRAGEGTNPFRAKKERPILKKRSGLKQYFSHTRRRV
jgi:putative NIF3 family GTP cyclohydrolase 1 type 2